MMKFDMEQVRPRYMVCKWFVAICMCLCVGWMQGQESDTLIFSASPAPEWTSVFVRDSGWFGADGIFSIPLSGMDRKGNAGNTRTLLIFSDTYVGQVENGKPVPGAHTIVNNTMAIVEGMGGSRETVRFLVNEDAEGNPTSFFVPSNTLAREGEYFWMGDGFVRPGEDTVLFLFAYHIEMTGPNVFDFRQNNVSLIKVPILDGVPLINEQEQIPTDLQFYSETLGQGSFGSGIFVNTVFAGSSNPDGFVYVYGVAGEAKHLVCARVKAEKFQDLGAWEFRTADGWSSHIQDVASLGQGVSNELSVTPLDDGRFLAVFQVFGISDKVGAMVADNPAGPFGSILELYTTPEYSEGLLPYNAKAHFNLSAPGELLISYNTITLDFWNDILENAHIYRPRFIRVSFDKAKGN